MYVFHVFKYTNTEKKGRWETYFKHLDLQAYIELRSPGQGQVCAAADEHLTSITWDSAENTILF